MISNDKTRQRAWDPLYGLLRLSTLEQRFIYSPEIQRLRHIRLCNIDSLLIPGASNVSRFEHALGVLRLVNEWISLHHTTPSEADSLRIAAIVHDMQSGPFGHSIQYILEDNEIGTFLHEDVASAREKQFHQHIRANASYQGELFQVQALSGVLWKQTSSLINGKGRLGKLISGEIDFDNIDNVVRLAFHAGLCAKSDRSLPLDLARNLSISHGALSLSADKFSLVSRWQAVRKQLYDFLLLDWAEFSAKAMLTRAFEEAVLQNRLGIDNWRMTDDELIQYFLTQVGDGQSIKELSRRLRLGQLYSPIFLGESPSIESYKTLNRIETKRDIEQKLRKSVYHDKPSPQLIIHFILDINKTERAVNLVESETQKSVKVGNSSRRLLIGLFASKRISAKEISALSAELRNTLEQYNCDRIDTLPDPLFVNTAETNQLDLL